MTQKCFFRVTYHTYVHYMSHRMCVLNLVKICQQIPIIAQWAKNCPKIAQKMTQNDPKNVFSGYLTIHTSITCPIEAVCRIWSKSVNFEKFKKIGAEKSKKSKKRHFRTSLNSYISAPGPLSMAIFFFQIISLTRPTKCVQSRPSTIKIEDATTV